MRTRPIHLCGERRVLNLVGALLRAASSGWSAQAGQHSLLPCAGGLVRGTIDEMSGLPRTRRPRLAPDLADLVEPAFAKGAGGELGTRGRMETLEEPTQV